MKRILLLAVAIIACQTVNAQKPGIRSDIMLDKLNFEAPLFGVTKKNVKPKWSVVAFGEVSAGFSYRFNVPEQIHPDGGYAELGVLELRYRPSGKKDELFRNGRAIYHHYARLARRQGHCCGTGHISHFWLYPGIRRLENRIIHLSRGGTWDPAEQIQGRRSGL